MADCIMKHRLRDMKHKRIRLHEAFASPYEAKRDQLLMHRRGALHGTKSCFTPSCATARFIQNKKTKSKTWFQTVKKPRFENRNGVK